MTALQKEKNAGPARGALARPLEALAFLLPLIIAYEAASLRPQDRVIAYDLLRKFFQLFGQVGVWAPGLAVVIILLATHAASRQPWKVRWRRVGLMYLEAVLFAVPLLVLRNSAFISAGANSGQSALQDVAIGIGAGIYEELIFRLVLISVFMMIGVDLLKWAKTPTAVMAVVLSSLIFAGIHHAPIGLEPFRFSAFAFRTIAGAYLAAVFWFRGYGPAAGCHAAYNAAIVVMNTLDYE